MQRSSHHASSVSCSCSHCQQQIEHNQSPSNAVSAQNNGNTDIGQFTQTLQNVSWATSGNQPLTLTYSYNQISARIDVNHPGNNIDGLSTLSAAQQAAVDQALALWGNVANIQFIRTDDSNANISFQQGDLQAGIAGSTVNTVQGLSLIHI